MLHKSAALRYVVKESRRVGTVLYTCKPTDNIGEVEITSAHRGLTAIVCAVVAGTQVPKATSSTKQQLIDKEDGDSSAPLKGSGFLTDSL